jgi:hypothetical protein
MADETDVSVRFGAQTDDLNAGVAAATETVQGFGDDVGAISAAIAAQTEAMTAGFAQLGETVTASMTAAKAATAEEEEEMQGLLATVRGGVESFNELKESVMGFGELVLAAFAVHEIAEFVNALGEAGERVQHTAQAFGMTTGEVERLQAVFTAAGAGPETLGMAMMRLDRAASSAVSGNKQAADAFKDLGVNLAQPATAAQRMQQVLEGFANIPGPQRAAVAMGVFGRQIMQVAPLLGLTKEQLAEFSAEADRFGAVNEEAVGHMAALGAALNENKVAFTGLQNVLGDALSGAFIQVIEGIDDLIASFVQSYQSGGLARQSLQLLATTVSALEVVFAETGRTIVSVWNAITDGSLAADQALSVIRELVAAFAAGIAGLGYVVREVADIIGAFVQENEVAWAGLGQVMEDVMSLRLNKIVADTKAAAAAMVDIVRQAGRQMAGEGDALASELNNLRNGGDQKTEASPTAVASTPIKLGGEKNAKKPKDDLVSQWTEQLRQLQNEQANWYADQNQLAAEFWSGIVAKAQGSAKDQQEARDKLAEANKALDAEDVDSAISAAGKKAEAAKGNVDQVQAIYAQLETMLAARHAQGGADWKKVEDAKTEAVRKSTAAMQVEQDKALSAAGSRAAKTDETSEKGADAGFDLQRDQVKANSSSGVIGAQQAAAQLAQIDRQQADADITAQDQALGHQEDVLLERVANAGSNAELLRQIDADLAKAQEENANRVAEIQTQAALKASQAQISANQKMQQGLNANISSIVTTFGNGMLTMAQRGGTLSSVMLKVGEDMEQKFVSAVEGMVSKWLLNMALGAIGAETQSALAASAQINKAAETAAANAYAAASAIPIIGPLLAPAAGAAAFVAVEAFASASGGYDIPAGVNPVTQLHAQEMVLPASIASPLRGMIAANSNTAGGSGGGAGSTTHNWNVQALDSRSVRGWARSGQGKTAIGQAAGSRR